MQTKEIPKTYEPKDVESKWHDRWIKSGAFKAPEDAGEKKPFAMVIPPPNVTGVLHMGHALNNTLQDILARFYRLKGHPVLWMPGTDHAGIATQNVVEKSLRAEGVNREDLGREKFIDRVWKWRDEYGNAIIEQLKRMGCSCDWERTLPSRALCVRITTGTGLPCISV